MLGSRIPGRAYVIVTRSQIAGHDLLGAPGTPARRVRERRHASRLFRVVYAGRDGEIVVLRRTPGGRR